MWTGEHSGGALDHLRVPPIDRSRAERTANGDPRLRYIFDAVRQVCVTCHPVPPSYRTTSGNPYTNSVLRDPVHCRQAPHPPQPARLNLNHDGFGDEGGRCLGAALKGLPEPLRLCSIGVASCNLTASGIAEIAAGVRGRSFAEPGLKVLNVSGNARLGDEGVMELLPLLVPTLEELYIANVGLGDVGMDALATKLPRAPALGILSCNANPNIVGFGWKALGATLSKLLVLKSLQAEGCSGMGDSGAGVLVAGILGCPVLETVNLHACKIGDEGACAVAKVLRERKQTQVLLIYTTGNE